jgi:hypothetical protein
MTIDVENIGNRFTILNIYDPTQDHILFWDNLLSKSFTKERNLIMGGDLNFSLGEAESWGQRAHANVYSYYFCHKLGDSSLLYIVPTKLYPTWRNKRLGEEHIAKRLDHFLISTSLVESPLLFRQRVGLGGEFDHYPIFLEVAGNTRKPTIPF